MKNDFHAPEARTLADALLKARKEGRALAAHALPATVTKAAEAYRVQALVARACGPVGGFKVANKPDAPRIMAPILAPDIIPAGARLAVPGDEQIGIELEVGFRIDAPLPEAGAPDRRAAIAGCLSAVPVIEIVRTRLPMDAPPMMKLADNQINGGLVVGQAVKDWQGLRLGPVQACLTFGGETVLDGDAAVPGGDAFENFLVLEEMIGDHCGGLTPGQVVITGSLNGLPYVRGGMRVEGRIDGLGAVSLDLDTLA
ncbi:2-keto-4-pentenoate hydratase [Aestuariicoccus sp. MJ-SS9]|uniref:2-keto-4-pentenoate hydratase n=1 Tax=Aestuariicoccus sp. MJ-SS9 TaxID=3079855 RepID=UPI002910D177|nr:2-keto-4-pentenoate hydratase [Aestuariicoccus sp. MJ-SS9]MDU8911652.1 2-keto-4-pentenoate hydratase [Aestuariicoccus sp. MJ-SS9]